MEIDPERLVGYEHKNISLKLIANDSISWTIHRGNLVVYEFAYEPERDHVVISHNDDPGDDHNDLEFLVIKDRAILNTLKNLGFAAEQGLAPSLEQTEKLDSVNNNSREYYWDLTDLNQEMSVVDEYNNTDDAVSNNSEVSLRAHSIEQIDASVYYDADEQPMVEIECMNQALVLTHENTTVHLYQDPKFEEVEHIKVGLIIDDMPHNLFLLNRQLQRALIQDYKFPKHISIRPTSIDLAKYAGFKIEETMDKITSYLEAQPS